MTSAAPTVSIVIPAFQAAATLQRAADSLVAQGFGEWEALIVDDGSTDDTRRVADAIAARDRRFRVFHQANLGASAARNAGLRAARGQWIGFLDADDWFDPAFLQTLLDLRGAAPDAGVLYCDFALVDAAGAIQEEQRVPDLSSPFRELGRSCSLSVHCALTRSDIMQRAGLFDESLAINEDWDLWQRIARTGTQFRGVRQMLAFYFTRPDSLSRRKVEALARDGIEVIERIFRADPNIPNPDPRFANGLPAEERLPIELEWILMCAGNAIALDLDPLPFLDLVPGLGDAVLIPEDAMFTLTGALAFARCVEIVGLAPAWPELEPKLDAFLTALGGRLGQHRAIDTARAYVRRAVFGPGKWIDGYRSTAIHAERIDIAAALKTVDPQGRDVTILDVFDGQQSLGLVEIPSPAAIPPKVIAEAIGAAAAWWPNRKGLLKQTPLTRMPRLLFHSLKAGAQARGWGFKEGERSLERLKGAAKLRAKAALAHGLVASIAGRLKAEGPTADWDQAIAGLTTKAGQAAAAVPPPAEVRRADESWRDDVEVNSPEYWNQVFEKENPWAYDSPYEQRKYEQTLSLLPAGKPKRAIELACAEGHFTVQLAPYVGHLTATDISQIAVERAGQRCRNHDNIDYRQLDFFNNPIGGGPYDLIVCSEVLYETGTREKLESVARNIADHLAPGGALVTAHIIEVTEERDRSGFDWGGVFGAKSVRDAMLKTGRLQLEEEIETELYRVQRYRRVDAPLTPVTRIEEMGAPPERDYAHHVVWGGTTATWAEVAHERALAVPILMYHRIAERDDGPLDLAQYRVSPAMFEEQLKWLRQNGYHGITPAEWLEAVRSNRAISGRPVMLTFDDGYKDFAETAWPILGRWGIPATVAVVTDLVGGHSDWDARFGPTAPLMDWADIARVSSEGAIIASHSARHPALTSVSGTGALDEALRSRAAIERATGIAPDTVVYPYGIYDRAAAAAFRIAGYSVGLGTRPGSALILDDPMHLPRYDVNGFDDLDTFVAQMGKVDPQTGVTRGGSAA